ncbi:DUF2380 domain-containing protein [Grimontia sp. NTOU-MAR1]|uniref:DUF2380 domain-containing protein n=1 Tax=Grimontia sp. NTOU-MAR1 TaxID=3111011 RepID=UPI002DBB348A|nr:DUF2380 domain-containing protein [Grimontia sp. NTOU-MAR1]WRV96353.1 DUF2380 domain-containing protein [Grimontia sp. NTOU-MAR1]
MFATLFFSTPSFAAGIAVLNFELADFTQIDDNTEEVVRTASLAPMLRKSLADEHGYATVQVPLEAYENANQGFGYLFEHTDSATELGESFDADWIVITRLHKPSFLFSYLIVQVVNVKAKLAYPELIVEIKGQQSELNQRGIDKLAEKIHSQIKQLSRTSSP